MLLNANEDVIIASFFYTKQLVTKLKSVVYFIANSRLKSSSETLFSIRISDKSLGN